MIGITEYEIIPNEQYEGSNEVYFNSRPSAEVIQALKNLRMRWNPRKGCWYGFRDVETIEAAINGGTETEVPARPEKRQVPAQKKNKYGVKVGDIFSASWGYDQTNTDYFQVIALAGSESVRVREVIPTIVDRDAYAPNATTTVYKLERDKMLPFPPTSVFIKDQERGDLKRLRKYGDTVSFTLSSFASAYLCYGDTDTAYDSER